MKTKLVIFVLGILLALPCALRAEEVEILLTEVVSMSTFPGEDPMDGPGRSGYEPACPTCFRATIDGHYLRIVKQAEEIPSAQVSVVNATNGGLVLNQSMTDFMEETISDTGVYMLHIETEGGALTGQFIVQ